MNLQISGSFSLPSYSDPAGLALTLTTNTQGDTSLPSFVTYASGTYSIAPTSFSQLGTYTIEAKACNLQPTCATYTFVISFVNHAPAFSSTDGSTQNANMNSASSHTLPSCSDLDGDSFTITSYESGTTVLPSFITFTSSTRTYSIAPTSFSQLGTYVIEAKACDGQPSCSTV